MPEQRFCGHCDAQWTGTLTAHFSECAWTGCGEYYCPTLSECPYCEGRGFDGYDDEELSDRYEGIHDYGYKPRPIWFGGEGAPYYLGFELEIGANEYNTAPIAEWCQRNGHPEMLYCKEDGSVEGFEIVSHPMTPEYFEGIDWPSFFDMLNTNWPLPYGETRENVGHGLHVHVSRTAFPHNSTLARWSYLLNKYRDHTQRVARRRSSNWARFTDYPVSLCLPYDNAHDRERWETNYDAPLVCGCCYERELVRPPIPDRIRRQFQTRAYPERYQAVNLTNSETVEVRVFRSTRKPDEFVSSLHYVIATVDFVRTMQPWHATRRATQWETFADYVASHPIFNREAEILTGVSPAIRAMRDVHAAAIREWARTNGIPVGMRGRISTTLRNQYAATLAV